MSTYICIYSLSSRLECDMDHVYAGPVQLFDKTYVTCLCITPCLVLTLRCLSRAQTARFLPAKNIWIHQCKQDLMTSFAWEGSPKHIWMCVWRNQNGSTVFVSWKCHQPWDLERKLYIMMNMPVATVNMPVARKLYIMMNMPVACIMMNMPVACILNYQGQWISLAISWLVCSPASFSINWLLCAWWLKICNKTRCNHLYTFACWEQILYLRMVDYLIDLPHGVPQAACEHRPSVLCANTQTIHSCLPHLRTHQIMLFLF